jgi:hypothetical protein
MDPLPQLPPKTSQFYNYAVENSNLISLNYGSGLLKLEDFRILYEDSVKVHWMNSIPSNDALQLSREEMQTLG